jgi:molybdopterin-binding protein
LETIAVKNVDVENLFVDKSVIDTDTCIAYITEILDWGAIMRLVVEVGISFAVVITKRSFGDMALREGMLVYITFKASAVQVF